MSDQKPLTRRERRAATSYRRILRAKEKASAEYERADRETVKLAKLLGGHGATARQPAAARAGLWRSQVSALPGNPCSSRISGPAAGPSSRDVNAMPLAAAWPA